MEKIGWISWVESRKVESLVTLTTLRRVHYGPGSVYVYAARIKEFGLTAYGNTVLEAETKVMRMLRSFVSAHEVQGTLGKMVLKTLGADEVVNET